APVGEQGSIPVPRPDPRLFDRQGPTHPRLSAALHHRARPRRGRRRPHGAGRGDHRNRVDPVTAPGAAEHPAQLKRNTKMETVRGKRVAVLVEKLYEDLELWYPVLRLREAGCDVKIVGPKAAETYTSKHSYP